MSNGVIITRTPVQYSGAGLRSIFLVLGVPHLYAATKKRRDISMDIQSVMRNVSTTLLKAMGRRIQRIIF